MGHVPTEGPDALEAQPPDIYSPEYDEWFARHYEVAVGPQHRATNTQEHYPETCEQCRQAAAYRGRHRAEG